MTSISPSTNKKVNVNKQVSVKSRICANVGENGSLFVALSFSASYGKKKKKKLEKLDEPRNEKRKVRSNSNSVATLPPSSLVSPRVNIECKYIPPAGYLGKMKRGEFERND